MTQHAQARKVGFLTLGCKVNQYETQAMMQLFEDHGDQIVDGNQVADIYVINTCTVTSVGDKKSRQFIRRAKRNNPAATIVVVGCYAQIAPDEVLGLDGVNLVLGTDQRAKIIDYIDQLDGNQKQSRVTDIMDIYDFEPLTIDKIEDKTRVFLKIQEGCNQYCSYCIIPYARGNIRSREPQAIYDEVARLVTHGFKEFVLTGIHLTSYGLDFIDKRAGLIDVVENIAKIDGVARIRLGSLEPRVIDGDFIARLAQVKQFCPQFHLSLQSGCDRTLVAMNRKYNSAQYADAVKIIRNKFAFAAITTDIIVGFPGETDDDFEMTYRFVGSIGFAEMHVFKYSKRQGTKAALMPNQIAETTKSQRSERLISLAEQLKHNYLQRFINTRQAVLIEKVADKGHVAKGTTVYHSTVELTGQQLKEGQIVCCKITGHQTGILQAVAIQ